MTEATAGQQSDLHSHEFPPEEGVDLKLLLNPRSGTQSRCASCRLKASCHPKVFFARVAALLAFHVLNAVLALSSAGLVLVFTAVSIAFLPIWFMIPAFFAFVVVTVKRFPKWNWLVFVLVFVMISAAIILLLGLGVFWIVLVGGPNVVVWGTLVQHFFACFDVIAVNIFASLDAALTNFIVARIPLQTYSAVRKDQTKFPNTPCDCCNPITWWGEWVVLEVFKKPAMWTAVFYFIFPKLLMGVLSAVSVWLSVVQPIVVIASSGRFSCVGTGTTFQGNPSVYVVIMVVFWVVGILALVLVPVCSVRLTAWRCGYAEQPEDPEATGVSSFVELEDRGAMV